MDWLICWYLKVTKKLIRFIIIIIIIIIIITIIIIANFSHKRCCIAT